MIAGPVMMGRTPSVGLGDTREPYRLRSIAATSWRNLSFQSRSQPPQLYQGTSHFGRESTIDQSGQSAVKPPNYSCIRKRYFSKLQLFQAASFSPASFRIRIFSGDLFIEREDSTTQLLNTDGSQVTCFPDGTRIVVSFTIEPEEITVELTYEENRALVRALAREYAELYAEEDEEEAEEQPKEVKPKRSKSRSKKKLTEEKSKSRERVAREKSRKSEKSKMSARSKSKKSVKVLIEEEPEEEIEMVEYDGFVSVVLNCSMEHPNYARVVYSGDNLSCSLQMPGQY